MPDEGHFEPQPDLDAMTIAKIGSANVDADTLVMNIRMVAGMMAGFRGSSMTAAQRSDRCRTDAATIRDHAAEAIASVNALLHVKATLERLLRSIRDVAHKTRVLALNAQIEAARAGRAGAGFQVVANEVKLLAGESRQIIDLMNAEVGGVTQSVGAAVTGIEAIEQALDDLVDALTAHDQEVAEQRDAAASAEAIMREAERSVETIAETYRALLSTQE